MCRPCNATKTVYTHNSDAVVLRLTAWNVYPSADRVCPNSQALATNAAERSASVLCALVVFVARHTISGKMRSLFVVAALLLAKARAESGTCAPLVRTPLLQRTRTNPSVAQPSLTT
eukprot:scaffold260_cov274-Pinguiococcus_pyrenoidosus.AAC.12